MKNIAVLFGGESVEHDVSVITGLIVMSTLSKSTYNVIPVYIDKNGKWFTGEKLKDVDFYKNYNEKKLSHVTLCLGENVLYRLAGKKQKPIAEISSAINCMHGGYGEDGSVAGLLKICKIPLASPPTTASGICMDKCATKIFLKGIGVKTLPYIRVKGLSDVPAVEKKFKYPVIVKPSTLGSSIGIGVASDKKSLEEAILCSLKYSESALVEPFIEYFDEINCAVYSDMGEMIASECEKPIRKSGMLSFSDKYLDGEREFPANIPMGIKAKIQNISKKIYEKLDCQGIIRIDFMVMGETVLVNEINTVPGSLAYYLFCDTTEEFCGILKKMIDYSTKIFACNKTLINSFPSSVLNIKGAKGTKHL